MWDTWHAKCQHAWLLLRLYKGLQLGYSYKQGGAARRKEEGKREREERRREREEKKRKGKKKRGEEK